MQGKKGGAEMPLVLDSVEKRSGWTTHELPVSVLEAAEIGIEA